MDFSEKLKVIRKENGMSQEVLAERLDVSRQAVSKWESGQGYPEIEKIIIISEMFDVSIDFLLKDQNDHTDSNDTSFSSQDGNNANYSKHHDEHTNYYVTCGTASEYFEYQQRVAHRIGLGIAIIIFGLTFPMLFIDTHLGSSMFLLISSIGVGVLLKQYFSPKQYEDINKNPLVFDFPESRQDRYNKIQERYGMFIIAGVILLVLSVVFFVLTRSTIDNLAKAAMPTMWAIATYLFIKAGYAFSSADVITNNDALIKELEFEKRSEKLIDNIFEEQTNQLFEKSIPKKKKEYDCDFVLITAIYCILGAVLNLWAIAWIIYPAAIVLCEIMNFIESKKT